MNNTTTTNQVTSKICTKCGEDIPFSEYYKHPSGKFGLRPKCKKCLKEYNQANKESSKEYYQANKETIKESIKKYYQANKESIKESSKEYYQANKESIKESIKEYNQANKESIKEYKKEYNQANKETINKKANERNKTRRQSDSSFRIRQNIRVRLYDAYCAYSTKGRQVSSSSIFSNEAMEKLLLTEPTTKGYDIDHIIPISVVDCDNVEHLKLIHSPYNLRWLPALENQEKSNKIDWDLIEANPKLIQIANLIGLKK